MQVRLVKSTLLAMILVSFAGVGPSVAAGGMYASVSAGINFHADSDIDSASLGAVEVESSFDTGFVLMGAIGTELSSGIRIEGELSYRQNEFNDITLSVPASVFGTALTVSSALDGDLSTFALMANAAYDFNKGEKLRPYIMAGIGIARVDINDAIALSSLLADDSDTVFAFQVGGGVNYHYTEEWAFGASYRYFSTTDPEFTAVDGSAFEADNENHSFLLSVTRRF